MYFIRSCLTNKNEIMEDNLKDFRLEDNLKFLKVIFEVSWNISINIKKEMFFIRSYFDYA